ncbi:prepilin peptidase [Fructobacillus parabroussonetiae]|uniref:Prepilin peptidase n=1 Tax=Fructobacillus parabroussonetiae TaxID=2713174 RepID=A0ABS5QZQ7_9LACO|nr:prepilin peptidase [Fructobacillus parabroussonetiae]MBS9337392.1 prepilin peptidase [Fructobacillus parabroussonetiae]
MTILLFLFIASTICSFLLALADRLTEKRPLWTKRSYCFACGHQLSPFELIPFFSALASRLRCRHCQQPFEKPLPFFFFEFLCPLLFTLLFLRSDPFSLNTFLGFLLFFLAREDARQYGAHTDLCWPFVGYQVLTYNWSAFSIANGLLLILVSFFILRKQMGGGDLAVLILAFFSFSAKDFLLVFFLAASLAFCFGLVISKRAPLPFLPFLLLAWLLIQLLHT